MSPLRLGLVALALVSLSSAAFAADKQKEAAALIEHARQLSDIRADGSPAFRLTIHFKAVEQDGSAIEGSYTEMWASRSQWRKETIAGEFHRIELATDKKRFLLEPPKPLPGYARDLPALVDVGSFQPDNWNPKKMESRTFKGARLRCIDTPAIRGGVQIGGHEPEQVPSVCFDQSNGLLVAKVEPSVYRPDDAACVYSDYQSFGSRTYPRSVRCEEGVKLRLEAKVVELSMLDKPEPELFAVPAGAKESTGCRPARPPKVIYNPPPEVDPSWGNGVVTIGMHVGVDGSPHDLKVLSSPNPKLDKAALDAVRRWKFNPASCEGAPVDVEIAVEVDSHVAH